MRDEQAKQAEQLCAAVRDGDGQAVAQLLARDAGLVSVFMVEPRDWGDEMWLAIHYAAVAGDVRVGRLLLDAGASADSRTRFRTPMHARETAALIAAREGHVDLLRLFLDRHAQIEVRDATHLSPLSHAAARGHAEVVEFLIDRGAMLDAVDDQQRTPLHWAIRGGHVAVAERLIDAGADVNHLCPKEPEGFTPLHRCVSVGSATLPIARRLVERGADVAAADPRFGKSAGDLAREAEDPGFCELLA